MSTKKKQSSLRFDSGKLYLLIIPLAAYLLPGACLMGIGDTLNAVRFALAILLFGSAAFPLAIKLFPLSRSGGFTLAKPLGLLSCGRILRSED